MTIAFNVEIQCLQMLDKKIFEKIIDIDAIIFLDVFFATTSMVTFLSNGGKNVFLCNSLDDLHSNMSTNPTLYAATERHLIEKLRVKYPTAPLEKLVPSTPTALVQSTRGSQQIYHLSSNGTPGLVALNNYNIYVSSMLNISATCNHILTQRNYKKIAIVCAGGKYGASIEDDWCAGLHIIHLIKHWKYNANITLDSYAISAVQLAQRITVEQLKQMSPVARLLQSRGENHELTYSLQRDIDRFAVKSIGTSVQRI